MMWSICCSVALSDMFTIAGDDLLSSAAKNKGRDSIAALRRIFELFSIFLATRSDSAPPPQMETMAAKQAEHAKSS
jgi:hypothetical protein